MCTVFPCNVYFPNYGPLNTRQDEIICCIDYKESYLVFLNNLPKTFIHCLTCCIGIIQLVIFNSFMRLH